MNDSDIDQDLRMASVTPRNELPPRFSTQVLKKARVMRDAARAHWRLLTVATVIAFGVAIVIGKTFAQPSQNTPPSIPVFDSNSTMFPTLSSDS